MKIRLSFLLLSSVFSLPSAFGQSFYGYEYAGSAGSVSYVSTVLMSVEHAGQLKFEYPAQMKVVVRGSVPVDGATRGFTATFCAQKGDLTAAPVCTGGGEHFSIGDIKQGMNGGLTATLSGSLCVSVPKGQSGVLPHPDVYFKVRQNDSRQDLIPLTYIKPQTATRRTPYYEANYEIPDCWNWLEIQ